MCIQNFVTSRAVSFRLKDINLVVHTLLCLDDICVNQLSDISIQTSYQKKKEEEIDPLELKVNIGFVLFCWNWQQALLNCHLHQKVAFCATTQLYRALLILFI
uniref:Putative ovule protein n=1 Tax=Solanum chacoense TaxID=4108 RepID=A0A0V0GMH1_SOLCH